jgi:hypothetical protein
MPAGARAKSHRRTVVVVVVATLTRIAVCSAAYVILAAGSDKEEQRGTQNQRGTEQRGAQDNDRGGTQERMGRDQDQDRDKAVSGQVRTSGREGGASVQLSQEQRTKIKGVIVGDRNVARVDHADFNIRVGVAVPRTVHVAVLPPEVVTIVPEYRGFEYVVVSDQLLIIDPNTLEIVAILPA